MENMETYYMQYAGNTNEIASETKTNTDYYTGDYPYGYPDPYFHPVSYIYPYYSAPLENPTERAFKILKVLVKEKVIKEPDSFDKFVKLVEKIAKAI